MSKAIGKYKPTLRIDRRTRGARVASDAGSAPVAPPSLPAQPKPPAPTGLNVTSTLQHSAVTPSARVDATWANLEAYAIETYVVQISTSSSFAANVETYRTGVNTASISIDKRAVNTTYYVRVATVVNGVQSAWSGTGNTTTPTDTVAPSQPSSVSATFVDAGDLLITWTNPTNANFRDVEISIYASNGGALLARAYSTSGRYVWTAAQNRAANSGTGDPTLYVTLRSRNWNETYASAVTASPTKSAPGTPANLATSWTGDSGTAAADMVATWDAVDGASSYVLSIDGVGRTVYAPPYTYTLDANSAAHSGTPDPVLSLSVWAMDDLKQISGTPATGTATNAAPGVVSGVSLLLGAEQMRVTISGTPPADLDYYSVRIVKDGVTQTTLRTKTPSITVGIGTYGAGAYQAGVTAYDVFGQASSEVLSSSAFLDPFNLTSFRAGAGYRDSDSNSAATLAVLKDTNTASGGVTY